MYKDIKIPVFLVIFLMLLMCGLYIKKITYTNAKIEENGLFNSLCMNDIQLIRDTSCGNGGKEHIFNEEKSIQIINILKKIHIEQSEMNDIFYGGYSIQIEYKDGSIDNVLFPTCKVMCYNGTYYKTDNDGFYALINLLNG